MKRLDLDVSDLLVVAGLLILLSSVYLGLGGVAALAFWVWCCW